MPTTFVEDLASEYLIDGDEQVRRQTQMKKLCNTCHRSSRVNQHFAKMDNTLVETDKMVYAATQLLLTAGEKGIAEKNQSIR
ncbi:MAG TPA: hypothetical protein EYP21_04520 [Syntrophaceae bacterium]|nr:hypothetical protein [Syntrophaceae bacterium]